MPGLTMEIDVCKSMRRSVWLTAVLAISLLSSAHAATHMLSDLIDTVIRKGADNLLPAHLSMVFGVSRIERAMPVKQAVMRDGSTVRTFNVCTANHEDVVLITYNEESKSSKAYLLSPTGVLRKAVAFQAGAPATERALRDAAGDFASEIKFWTDFERSLTGSK